MRELLKARLKAAGVAAEAEQAEKLAAFHSLLTGANARMNLTRVSADPAEAIDRNYLDSLAPLPHLSGAKTCVDVGSGAGFPGVPLAIFLPDTHFVLMDSLLKRVEFLRGVIKELSLNAEAVCLRAEEAGRGDMRERFDAATARAVAPLNVLCELLLPDGRQQRLVRMTVSLMVMLSLLSALGGLTGEATAVWSAQPQTMLPTDPTSHARAALSAAANELSAYCQRLAERAGYEAVAEVSLTLDGALDTVVLRLTPQAQHPLLDEESLLRTVAQALGAEPQQIRLEADAP